jgi:C-terminal processing protease CtpA/Prc
MTSARTYSAAEDFAIAFRQLDRGPIIGQTTGGSFRICTKRDTAGSTAQTDGAP